MALDYFFFDDDQFDLSSSSLAIVAIFFLSLLSPASTNNICPINYLIMKPRRSTSAEKSVRSIDEQIFVFSREIDSEENGSCENVRFFDVDEKTRSSLW